MRNPSTLLSEPTLHPGLYLIMIDQLFLVRFTLAALDSFANIERVLDVFPAYAVWQAVENSSRLFFCCGHLTARLQCTTPFVRIRAKTRHLRLKRPA